MKLRLPQFSECFVTTLTGPRNIDHLPKKVVVPSKAPADSCNLAPGKLFDEVNGMVGMEDHDTM